MRRIGMMTEPGVAAEVSGAPHRGAACESCFLTREVRFGEGSSMM
jgi:hypothetical protein